jgi:HK97 family phage portal protein
MNLGRALSSGIDILTRSASVSSNISYLVNPEEWLKGPFTLGGFTAAQDSGVPVTSKSIQQIPAYISGLRLLSETVASLSGKLIQKTDESITYLRSDPRNKLCFRKPSRMMNSVIFWETATKYAVHKGNFFAIILRDEDMNPIEFVPIHESKSVTIIESEGELFYDIQGVGILPAYMVLHFKGLGDGIIGIGAIEYAATTAGVVLATQKNQAKFFKSGSKLQGYITHPKQLKKETMTKLRESWHSLYHSDASNNSTAFLDEGMEYKTVSVTPEAAKYLETLKNGYYDIAAILRVPPHMIALMDKSSFNNIEQQSLDFVKYGLLIWIMRFEAELNDKCLTEAEKLQDEVQFKFNLEALLRGDYKSRMEGYRIAINAGIMSQNEARKLEDMSPYEGGNEHWLQMNMMPLSMAKDILNRTADQLVLKQLNSQQHESND